MIHKTFAGLVAEEVIRRVRGTANWIASLDSGAMVPVNQMGTTEESLADAVLVLHRDRQFKAAKLVGDSEALFREVVG